MEKATISKITKIVFLIAGLLLLALLLKSFGVNSTIEHIKELKWGFAAIVGIHLVTNVAFAYTLRLFISQDFTAKQFVKLVFARIAGDSTSALNALGAVAGEPIKAMYIRGFVPFKTGLAAVVLDRTIHSYANILTILTGVFASLFVLDIAWWITALVFLFVFIMILVMLLILKKQRDGLLEYILKKLPKKLVNRYMTEERWEKVKHLDEEIGQLLSKEKKKTFYLSLFIHYTGILVIASLELFLIVRFTKFAPEFTIVHAFFVYIFGFICTTATFFIPGNFGTLEGSYSIAMHLIGLNPELGVSVGIIRRLRSFVWAGIGMLLLFYAGLLHKEPEEIR
ncbi:MAG: flippase-like domain-containing protein [bacterium]|nr:flippase-like domain-containing protein [bacterium]